YFVGCMGYPDCKNVIWLPDFILEASVEESVCDKCTNVNKMKFKYKRGSVPPMIQVEDSICIGGCDEMVNEVFNISKFINQGANNGGNSRPPTQNSRTQNNRHHNNQNTVPYQNNRPHQTTVPFQNNRSQNTVPHQNNKLQNTMPYQNNRPQNQNGDYPVQNGRAPLNNRDNSFNNGRDDCNTGSTTIVCNCGEDGLLLTVRKDGPNQGRQFYKCSKPQGTGCNFFLWADENNPNNNSSNNFTHRNDGNINQTSFNRQVNNTDNVQCNCNVEARSLVVQKEGPNKGKSFYGCPKPRNEGCGFFQWADQPPGNGGGGTGWTNNGSTYKNKQQGGAGPQDGATKKRKCGICHVEGHTRKTCPQR
ncbi:hypothetical protein LOTGIDRAFT_168441, partial [Lottia gigantea]